MSVQNNKSNKISVNGSITIPNQQSQLFPHFATSPYNYPLIHKNFPYTPNIPMFIPNNNNIINNYQITTPKVSDDHTFFEMTLPESPEGKVYKSSNNLKERIIILNYIRNSLVKISDGEYINIDDNYSNETKNLMSYIKILHLNPYNLNLNPYKDLPNDFMIYSSGFPVFKTKSNTIDVNRNNVGLNLRIYNINNTQIGPIISFKYANTKNSFLTNKVNNDIYFYNFVKNELILKNICSHFPIIHAYFISSGKNKNFKKYFKTNYDKLISLKRDKFFQENKINNNSIFDQITKISTEKLIKDANQYFELINEPTIEYNFYPIYTKKSQVYYKLIIKENFDIKNNLLMALTEAPNLEFKDWYTNSYKNKDILKKVKSMVNNGYHVNEVWESILFQLYYTIIIMIINGIKINDFNLDNIFIKNISDNQKINGYWIYEIFGVKFYVKNYGFLLLIDSNFKKNIQFRDIEFTSDDDKVSFNKDNLELIKKTFDTLCTENILNDNIKPFIKKIHDTIEYVINKKDFSIDKLKIYLINTIFYLFGDKFLHNKIGCPIDTNVSSNFRKAKSGEIINYNGNYSIFYQFDTDNYIIEKDSLNQINIKKTLNTYYNVYNIEQSLNNDGSRFDLKQLLDTYVLN